MRELFITTGRENVDVHEENAFNIVTVTIRNHNRVNPHIYLFRNLKFTFCLLNILTIILLFLLLFIAKFFLKGLTVKRVVYFDVQRQPSGKLVAVLHSTQLKLC